MEKCNPETVATIKYEALLNAYLKLVEDPDSIKLLSICLATPEDLYKARQNPSVMEQYEMQAALLPSKEATELVDFFSPVLDTFLKSKQAEMALLETVKEQETQPKMTPKKSSKKEV